MWGCRCSSFSATRRREQREETASASAEQEAAARQTKLLFGLAVLVTVVVLGWMVWRLRTVASLQAPVQWLMTLTALQVLTGMGNDGADAFAEIKKRGGKTIAESEDTAVVFGMPAELIERGGASLTLRIEKIATQLKTWAARG